MNILISARNVSFLLRVAFSTFLFLPIQNASAANTADFAGATYSHAAAASNLLDVTTIPGFERYDSANRWQTVRALDLLAEMKKFQGVKGSPALRAIWHDVLLSDFSGLHANTAEQADLMAMRLSLLNKLGFFDEAVRLYQQAALKKPVAEKIAREAIDSFALSGSADGACLETMMAAQSLGGDDWTQDAALCARYFGQEERADELYNKVSDKAGGGFRAVYKMLGKNSARAIQAEIPPLWRALLLERGATLTRNALTKADPMELASIAQNKHVPLDVRLAAASRAADAGTVGMDRLRKLYEAKHDTDGAVSAIAAGVDADVAQKQSDLYAAARFTFEGNARARIVEAALNSMKPRTNVKSHVYGWIVDKLTLQPERITWFAPHGYALMMATNRADSAKIYYESGHLEDSTLSIIEALEEGKPWTMEQQNAWKSAMKERFGASGDKRIAASMGLLKAYDSENKLALADTKNTKNDASMPLSFLKDSVQKGGRGLTLVTALNRLASTSQANQLSTGELSEMAKVFAKEGLYGPRKKITLEILIQNVL